jgi:predicted enzyme related to lactoylglutathione lyase
MQNNPVVFWKLAAHDMDGTKGFFKGVFERDIQHDERLGFNIIPGTTPTDESIGGGIFRSNGPNCPSWRAIFRLKIFMQKPNLSNRRVAS